MSVTADGQTASPGRISFAMHISASEIMLMGALPPQANDFQLAFCCGAHARLGADSPVKIISEVRAIIP